MLRTELELVEDLREWSAQTDGIMPAGEAILEQAATAIEALLIRIDGLREAGRELLAKLDVALPANSKPTIHELEHLLESDVCAVEMAPDGSLRGVPRAEIEAFRALIEQSQ